jgi:hypothetical protein
MIVVIIIVALPLSDFIPTSNAAENPLIVNSHVQPVIWNYDNTKNQPETAVVVNINQQEWQASAAACIVPAFIDWKQITPIMFDDGTENRTVEIPHNIVNVTEFGADIASASEEIASTYWSKAEIVIITDTYEHILWAVPIASFLSAPILVDPLANTLQTLGTRCIIFVGETRGDIIFNVEQNIELRTREDVWNFQMDLFDTKGQRCDYIVVTNPYDITDDPNIKWKFMSLV